MTDLLIWRWDRLSRDQGDFATLVKLFERHGVKVHSVNEVDLDLASASGRMQIGVHGVFAQYYRDEIVENTRMGTSSGGRARSLAQSCTYRLRHGQRTSSFLTKLAPLVRRIFALPRLGASYPEIAAAVEHRYSTARHICATACTSGKSTTAGTTGSQGFTLRARRRGERFNAADWSLHAAADAVGRGRALRQGPLRPLRPRWLTSLYNERSQAFVSLSHIAGEGCAQPGRSANGLSSRRHPRFARES